MKAEFHDLKEPIRDLYLMGQCPMVFSSATSFGWMSWFRGRSGTPMEEIERLRKSDRRRRPKRNLDSPLPNTSAGQFYACQHFHPREEEKLRELGQYHNLTAPCILLEQAPTVATDSDLNRTNTSVPTSASPAPQFSPAPKQQTRKLSIHIDPSAAGMGNRVLLIAPYLALAHLACRDVVLDGIGAKPISLFFTQAAVPAACGNRAH